MNKEKIRLDELLIIQGHFANRSSARAAIMAGEVLVNEFSQIKAGYFVKKKDVIRLREKIPFVSRGGLKLQKALKHFRIDVTGLNCIDIGSSTGGFTDCLLQSGAAKVQCIDVGTNQLAYSLRTNPQVLVKEQTNARNLSKEMFDRVFNLAVMDVSFISIAKILPVLTYLFAQRSFRLIALIKPQFETQKKNVAKGGIVKDPEIHLQVLNDIKSLADKQKILLIDIIASPIKGQKGNGEYLGYFIDPALTYHESNSLNNLNEERFKKVIAANFKNT